ncbi:MAG: CopD family protein [Deltaproteobacteria bacterium]|nr:CopD family protein [Deltaproteobacteria bacterium]
MIARLFPRKILYFTLTLVIILTGMLIPFAEATDQYAERTGKGCIFCHRESAGGQLKTTGFAFIKNGYQYPIPERILIKAESLQSPFHKVIRFVFGYLHLIAAVIFAGTIFYIHIFIGPRQLKSGIPKGERILGVSCMAVLTVTGGYLTWVRIERWEQFFNHSFGLMLFIKIMLFLIMVGIGLTAITIMNSRMRKESSAVSSGHPEEITPDNLEQFNGTSGKAAYIVVENKVYDVSESAKWKEGRHFGKHQAGSDLTSRLKGAPHGPEVLEKVPQVGEISRAKAKTSGLHPGQRLFIKMAYINLVIIFLILACISIWRWDFPWPILPERRAEVSAGAGCIQCHQEKSPGIFHDWQESVHARLGIDCLKCHQEEDEDLSSQSHLKYDPVRVAVVVTPKTCAGCHPKEADQYSRSKHAHTWEIMWKIDYWLNHDMNNQVERTTGCYACHGSVVEVSEGSPLPGSWPNVGVGRRNPDGTSGSCSSCHTRHRFSVMEARKPEACDQCHLGPDHPQIEIYNESKHGTIYHAEGDTWNWETDDGPWKAGRDFRAPTCAACHMSAAEDVPGTHDVTERLSWETQAPLTVRPEAFAPFPADTDWRVERQKMKRVCSQCHSDRWTDDHFKNLDDVVQNYNELYYQPAKTIIDSLYGEKLLSRTRYFDEPLEWEFYELWHHEGRRARMGAAMMAPDYAWWHGFYELKHRFAEIQKGSESLRKRGPFEDRYSIPGRMKNE